MVTITAQNSLDDNNYTVTDISLVAAERLIDKAISYFNLKTGRGVALMDGVAESKTTTCQDDEYGVLEAIITCLFREAVKTYLSSASSTNSATSGANSVSAGGMSASESSSVSTAISASTAINNPANTILREFIVEGLASLREIEVSRG